MNRRGFLKQSVGSMPVGLIGMSCRSLEASNSKASGGNGVDLASDSGQAQDTLKPYTHASLELSDDFDGPALGPQWRVVGINTRIPAAWDVSWNQGRESTAAKVHLRDSRLLLTGRNDRTCGICIYGVYGGRTRVEAPWAMEAVMELPEINYANTPLRSGITMRVSNERNWGAYVELGRVCGSGIDKSFLFHEGSYLEGWTGRPEIESAKRVHLRIESADNSRRAIRVGMKLQTKDNWTWSPILKLSQSILWFDNLQLMNFDVRHHGLEPKVTAPPPLFSLFEDSEVRGDGVEPSGEEVTIAFDLARFEGKVFSRQQGIGYIHSDVPEIEVQSAKGDRYEALVPDTFDVEERARLGVHALTSLTDPQSDYEIYWFGDFNRRPPVLLHDLNDWVQPKFMESLPLLRMVSGSQENRHVDQRWSEVLLQMQGSDGLVYFPNVGRPWAWSGIWEAVGNREEHLLSAGMCARLLGAMTIYAFRDQNPKWREASDKLAAGLKRIVVDKGSYGYIPLRGFGPNAQVSNDDPPPEPGSQYAFLAAWVIIGLVQYQRATESPLALELAGKLVNYLKDHAGCYEPDGTWIGFPHFHCHTHGIQAMLEYGLLTNSRDLMQFCIQSYEHGKTRGNDLVGFFPEFYRDPNYPSVEICEVADMVAVSSKLALSGAHDAWEDLDRWARNHFAEGQNTYADWIYDHAARYSREDHWTLNESTEDVAERSIGAFGGWLTGSDFFEGRMGPFMHCCTGNATRAIYYLWESILKDEGDRVKINLLLNRTSPSLDMDSYIPFEGRVEMKMKQPRRLSIRIPAWTDRKKVMCRVNDQPRQFAWNEGYIDVGWANSGQRVSVEFPIQVRPIETVMGGKSYGLRIKGNEVVNIQPDGKICPIYQRDHYWHGPVRYKKVTRFCPQETINW